MTRPVGVLACGAAAPSLRLRAAEVAGAWGRGGGRGQAGVCAPDEDALTLAWDAATAAMRAAGLEPGVIDGLWWGTSRPPFAEGPSHAFLAAALGLRADGAGALLAGSNHAGVEALLAARDAVAAGTVSVALVVVSDAVVPGAGTGFEARAGAGAAALVLGAGGATAALTGTATRSVPVVDRYRGDGEAATRDLYDARLFREAVFVPIVSEVATALGAPAGTRWSLPDPDGRLGDVVARRVGAGGPVSAPTYAEVGDTGAAAAVLGTTAALAEPGPVALVAYGGGRATGVVIDVEAPVPGAAAAADALAGGRAVGYAEALRARGQLVASGEPIPMGVPPGGAAFVRGNPEMLGLLGARCADCGTVSTPPSVHPTCIACGGAKLEAVPLAREGTVHTFVVNHTMPAPFVAPLPLAVVDLDDGARLMVQVVGPGDDLAVGAGVELVLRRYALERGVPVYGYKARARRAGDA